MEECQSNGKGPAAKEEPPRDASMPTLWAATPPSSEEGDDRAPKPRGGEAKSECAPTKRPRASEGEESFGADDAHGGYRLGDKRREERQRCGRVSEQKEDTSQRDGQK
jgi:hypothetical protein